MKKFLKKVFRLWSELKSQPGLGLAEVMVALGLLGICGAIFVGALSSGSVSTRLMGEQVIARNLAQSQIEKIKNSAYDASGTGYSQISPPAGYSIAIQTDSTLYSNNNIQKIRVTVSHEGQPVLTLEEYKVNR